MPDKKNNLIFLFLFSISLFSVFGSIDNDINDPYFQKLEKAFLCVDGCGMALEDCSNRTAEQMRLDLFNFMDQGLSEIEIKMYMVNIYGNEVLREPPKSGFNLIVWIAPFLAILVGFVMIFIAINKWVYHRKVKDSSEETINLENNDIKIYSTLIDEERKKYF